jgi:SNF2 family DNA or RNA helicase
LEGKEVLVKLYPFQKEMVDKFVDVPNVLCGDEMGLGKTFEALALDLRRRTTQLNGSKQTNNKTLIVAPLSVLSSWVDHIKAIWPAARVAVIDPKNRQDLINKLSKPYHYYIVHWQVLRIMPELQDVKWWHVIADEVHRAKNRKAQQTLGLRRIHTVYKTGLSGTPADNNPQDLWSILNWLYPRIWTSFWSFTRYFVKIRVHNKGACLAFDPTTGEACGGYHKSGYRETVGVAHADELQAAIAPYYIRRLKEDVIQDLPDKYYSTITVDLQPKQRRIYNQMRSDMLAWVGKHEHEPIAAPVVIAQLVRLKQFALAYAELVNVIVRTRECPGEYCKVKCVGHEQVRVKLSDPSTKLDAIMEIIEDNPEEKYVVFSESKQIINLLATRLANAKISHVLLTGDTKQDERGQVIDLFQQGSVRVFAGTIDAGGIGITLTAASTVIFLDRKWNPSANRQAEDRLHRIGQKNAVHVIDVVARDTVDGGRLQQLKLKWSWLRELLGDKVQPDVVLEETSA